MAIPDDRLEPRPSLVPHDHRPPSNCRRSTVAQPQQAACCRGAMAGGPRDRVGRVSCMGLPRRTGRRRGRRPRRRSRPGPEEGQHGLAEDHARIDVPFGSQLVSGRWPRSLTPGLFGSISASSGPAGGRPAGQPRCACGALKHQALRLVRRTGYMTATETPQPRCDSSADPIMISPS
jgi:hypothetical protein